MPALMTSGYLGYSAAALVADDPYSVRLLAELMQRPAVAECMQWRMRRRPLGVEDWLAIAGEDTGSMFEICARLGTRDERLASFGMLLGLLYHGCDDVADVRGCAALGGGSEKDIADGILTLPAAIAIRNPETAQLFQRADSTEAFTERLIDTLDDAERYLDGIAVEAKREARERARSPERLLTLIAHTRELSRSEWRNDAISSAAPGLPITDGKRAHQRFTALTTLAHDLAASEHLPGSDPEFTAGVLLGRDEDGIFYIIDVVRTRSTPLGVQQLVGLDPDSTRVHFVSDERCRPIPFSSRCTRKPQPGSKRKDERHLPHSAPPG